jgi:hypothetical protein
MKVSVRDILQDNAAIDTARKAEEATLLVGVDYVGVDKVVLLRECIVFNVAFQSRITKTDFHNWFARNRFQDTAMDKLAIIIARQVAVLFTKKE